MGKATTENALFWFTLYWLHENVKHIIENEKNGVVMISTIYWLVTRESL